jgi:hypothetical protein
MDQLYIFFRDSPAINSTVKLKWDHKICYLQHVVPDIASAPINAKLTSVITGKCNALMKHAIPIFWHVKDIENDHIENMEFSIMHKPLYEEIEKWMNTDDTQDKPLWLQ